jgi:hypothetical protein
VRLGDPERERLFEALSRHAAEGRLDIGELERRVAIVAGARTVEEAESALADLPELRRIAAGSQPPPAPPAARPRWGRGHGDADRTHPGWQPTAERFRDPGTGRVMRVWEDADGGRHYVADT